MKPGAAGSSNRNIETVTIFEIFITKTIHPVAIKPKIPA